MIRKLMKTVDTNALVYPQSSLRRPLTHCTLKGLGLILLILASTAGIATAQDYSGYQSDCQQGWQQPQGYQSQPTQTLQPQTQIDPRAFQHRPIPLTDTNQGSSGVILGPHGQNYFWFENGR